MKGSGWLGEPGARPIGRWAAAALLVIVAVALLSWGVSAYRTYVASRAAYAQAERRCGGPPLVGVKGMDGAILVSPRDSDYESMKFSVTEWRLLTTSRYFCSPDEALSLGYYPR